MSASVMKLVRIILLIGDTDDINRQDIGDVLYNCDSINGIARLLGLRVVVV